MSKIKVLLIDDDEDDYIITKDVFNRINGAERYELTWIDTFEKGINAVLKHQFDIYLVDYRLGKHTGVDLVNEAVLSGIKEPIIILTGKGDYKIDEEAMNVGAADYLIKDKIEPDTLDRSIRYALKQSETLKALKESENKFKIIFDKAKEPILISDYTGKIHDINKAGLQFFGYHIKEMLELNDRSLFYTQEDRENFIQELETKGAVSDFECQMVSNKGQVYFCSLSSFLQIDPQNMVEVYHTIIHDLTHRKHQETKFIHESKFSISEHIAKGFAEEIRNPLSTINLVLYDLTTDESLAYNETLQSNLETIKNNIDDINQLTRNFIESTENKPISTQKNGINQVIEEALAEINDLILGHRIVLEKHLLPSEVYLSIDKKQIKKALVNILKNAVEGMETYPKVLNISSINDSGFYSILIEDNGKGINQDLEHQIFEPFFTTKKDAEGLGLTEAERTLLAHNGNIVFKPQENGSLFVVKLPIN
ncbi:MAG: response regulator [Pedobacter sp.]|uniref:hybrid sensor histidine kinase/response regulator n=1 Tax=Pedobacter sp. TaxID=1411316 RepID=UPI002809FB73|nr:ATP-binding protein [Pedobacter sp.]MDQ8006504.1 response regulator [Pedobacter sp.]